jgi:hypothetical protein
VAGAHRGRRDGGAGRQCRDGGRDGARIALAPLSGALAAYPALGSAAAQGLGVFKLGTAGWPMA